MIRWNLHEDQHQAVGIGDTKLDEPPRLLRCTLEDGNPGGAQLSFRDADVAHLKPELG